MDAAVIVALIALAGTVGNVALTYGLNARSERRREMQRSDAQWARYKASLRFAADELASRIDNILSGEFLDAYGIEEYEVEAVQGTLFRFGQYFGWSEVVRRYARDPELRHAQETQRIEELQRRVASAFNTDRYGAGGFMIWRDPQRAVGELMIMRDGDVVDVISLAGFVSRLDQLRPWMKRMEETMRNPPADWDPGERERLRDARQALGVLADDIRPSSRSRSRRR